MMAGPNCALQGGAAGKASIDVTCQGFSETIVIPLDDPDAEGIYNCSEEPCPFDTLTEADKEECGLKGCVIYRIRPGAISVQGGPPNTSFWGMIMDGAMAAGAWLASKYAGGI